MSLTNNFMEQAKIVQDTYMSGNLQGQRYMLENMIVDLQSKLKVSLFPNLIITIYFLIILFTISFR